MLKKLAVINNKYCGLKSNKYKRYAADRMGSDIGADITFTEYPGHAEKIAQKSAGYDIIIVAGGDGTISEVVNGMDLEKQSLAILPLGTGNSLARDLGIGTLTRAFDVIRQERSKKIDILYCAFKNEREAVDRYTVTTSGIGFVSEVVSFGNRYLKMAGPLCYPISACFKLFNQDVSSAEIQIDDLPFKEIEFTNFLVNNTRHAGNVCVFPRAKLCDSALDLLFTKTNAVTQNLWNISMLSRTYFYHPGQKRANKLRVTLRKPSAFMLDGEIFDSVKEIKYSVIPKRLSVLI